MSFAVGRICCPDFPFYATSFLNDVTLLCQPCVTFSGLQPAVAPAMQGFVLQLPFYGTIKTQNVTLLFQQSTGAANATFTQ